MGALAVDSLCCIPSTVRLGRGKTGLLIQQKAIDPKIEPAFVENIETIDGDNVSANHMDSFLINAKKGFPTIFTLDRGIEKGLSRFVEECIPAIEKQFKYSFDVYKLSDPVVHKKLLAGLTDYGAHTIAIALFDIREVIINFDTSHINGVALYIYCMSKDEKFNTALLSVSLFSDYEENITRLDGELLACPEKYSTQNMQLQLTSILQNIKSRKFSYVRNNLLDELRLHLFSGPLLAKNALQSVDAYRIFGNKEIKVYVMSDKRVLFKPRQPLESFNEQELDEALNIITGIQKEVNKPAAIQPAPPPDREPIEPEPIVLAPMEPEIELPERPKDPEEENLRKDVKVENNRVKKNRQIEDLIAAISPTRYENEIRATYSKSKKQHAAAKRRLDQVRGVDEEVKTLRKFSKTIAIDDFVAYHSDLIDTSIDLVPALKNVQTDYDYGMKFDNETLKKTYAMYFKEAQNKKPESKT